MERQCDFINEVHLTGQIKHIHRNFEKRVAGIEVATYGGHPNYPEVLCLGAVSYTHLDIGELQLMLAFQQ